MTNDPPSPTFADKNDTATISDARSISASPNVPSLRLLWISLALALLTLASCLALLYSQNSRDQKNSSEMRLHDLGHAAALLVTTAGIDGTSDAGAPSGQSKISAQLDQLAQRSGSRRIAAIMIDEGSPRILVEGRGGLAFGAMPLTLANAPPILLDKLHTDTFFSATKTLGEGNSLIGLLPLQIDHSRRLLIWIETAALQGERQQTRSLLLFVLCFGILVPCLLLPLAVFWRIGQRMLRTRQDELTTKERDRRDSAHFLIETNEDLRRQINARLRTERKLQASEARFRDLVETTSDMVWEIDAAGRYTYVSPKVVDILGYSPEELLGTNPFDLMTPEEAARLRPVFNEIVTARAAISRMENIYIRRDGRQVVLETSGEPVLDQQGGIVGYRGIDRDVTLRRQEEKALREAKEKAERADRAKSEFLANMSHELRTPLHAILSFSSFGLKKLAKADRAELEKYFFLIHAAGKRLLPLINSLLDLAKLEADRIVYQTRKQDLLPTIETVLAELSALAEQKRITCRLLPPEVPSIACFDPERIGQVLRNLLGNALRLTECDRSITVSLSIRSGQDDTAEQLCVIISDQGMGIPPEELEAIFTPFTQSSRTRSGAGGTGLGLAICRRIVEDHHGRIWAANNDEGGASFFFTLPRSCPGNGESEGGPKRQAQERVPEKEIP